MRDLLPPASAGTALADVLDEAIGMLRKAGKTELATAAGVVPGPSLLQQCLDLCAAAERRQQPPLRLVMELPHAGGRMLAEWLACLPNVRLLADVDPLSSQAPGGAVPGLIAAARRAARPVEPALALSMFKAALEVLHGACRQRGEHVVLHTAADRLTRPGGEDESLALAWVDAVVPTGCSVKAVLVVRHPLASVADLAEACADARVAFDAGAAASRLRQFQRAAAGTPVLRLDDLEIDAIEQVRRAATHLELPWPAGIEDLLEPLVAACADQPAIQRPRAVEALDALAQSLMSCDDYLAVCAAWGYLPRPEGSTASPLPGGRGAWA